VEKFSPYRALHTATGSHAAAALGSLPPQPSPVDARNTYLADNSPVSLKI